jgi:fructan beta-fructosidase
MNDYFLRMVLIQKRPLVNFKISGKRTVQYFLIFIGSVLLLNSCKKVSDHTDNVRKEVKTKLSEYNEKYRPQFHFSPPEKWMNDPNGLVYHKGIYHLFYQYYPNDIVWGPMHWGHAISKDMIYWEQKPIALYPDEKGYIFSGSAVVDKNNTSGFGSKDNPPLVAVFTYHDMEGEKQGRLDYQTQGIAYSLDNGETWTKYEANPVIPNTTGIKDFRDPKVFWHEASKKWILVLVAKDHARFYSSSNLKEWTFLSKFGENEGAHGGVWECPDLFPLTIEGTQEVKWVLIISINPGGPNGGSATQYFVGDFDGEKFLSDQTNIRWFDYGTDNYAGVTYNNTLDNRRIFIGWMSNWNYARKTPTEIWRGAMTLPRALSLEKKNGEYFLKNYPLKELDKIINKTTPSTIKINDKLMLEGENLNQSEIVFRTAQRDFEISLANEEGAIFKLVMDKSDNMLYADRTKSGIIEFEPGFGEKIHEMPLKGLTAEEIEVRMIVDRSSVEIFINKGQYVMTQQIFPKTRFSKIFIENKEANNELVLSNFQTNTIKSIWNE